MQSDDQILLLLREVASFEVGPQVVDPSQPAALPASLQSCLLWDVAPASDAESGDVIEELLIFFGRPEAFPQPDLLEIARIPAHLSMDMA